MGIIKNAPMTTRHLEKDNRNMKTIRISSLIAAGSLLLATGAHSTVVDLINGDSGTITNSYGTAIFEFTQPQPTGTGYIQPFLRVQNDPSEQGYNTSGGTPFDDKAGPWTHHGSGSGDMFAYIPVSAFAGTASTDFVYMYVAFGGTDPSQGGFEEFTLVVNPIPEASTFFPIIGLLAAVFSTQFVRRRQLQQVSR